MLDYEGGTFVKLNLGFIPSPSGGSMCLMQVEEAGDVFILLHGYTPSLKAPERQQAIALVTIVGVTQSVFGYPNEEAFWCDSRGDVGHGFCEVQGSAWYSNLLEYNQRTYGSRNEIWEGWVSQSLRHFFVGSKDVSAQFLAEGLRVETFTDRPYEQVQEEAIRRMDNWYWWQCDGRPVDPEAAQVRSYPDGIGTVPPAVEV